MRKINLLWILTNDLLKTAFFNIITGLKFYAANGTKLNISFVIKVIELFKLITYDK